MHRRSALFLLAVVMVACASNDGPPDYSQALSRLDRVEAAVSTWDGAATVDEAHAAAADAIDLVMGGGTTPDGLLPSNTSDGLVLGAGTPSSCVERDVLGGPWDDVAARWAVLDTAVEAWAPGNNTFPAFPSHLQRLVGWARLTVASDSLDDAHEYAGHAAIHLTVARTAMESCSS